MASRDLMVVGGGVIGCSIAWAAARQGSRVTVVERGNIGNGASWAAGGMLAPLAESDGATPFLQLCRYSAKLYPDFVAELQSAVGIDVEYRTEGTLYLSLREEDDEELETRFRWQSQSGLNVERLAAKDALRLESSLNPAVRWALFYPEDRQVNNRRLVTAVHQAAAAAGVVFRVNSNVEEIVFEGTPPDLCVRGLRVDGDNLKAGKVIIAAGAWSSRIGGSTATGVLPVRGQMISVRNLAPPVRHVIYSPRAYLVPRLDGGLIAGSTVEEAGFDCSNTPGGISSITTNVSEMLPEFATQPIIETWAGLRPRAADRLPVIGPDPLAGGLFHATGHYRNGILLAPVTARIIVDLLAGVEPAIDILPFSPVRNRIV